MRIWDNERVGVILAPLMVAAIVVLGFFLLCLKPGPEENKYEGDKFPPIVPSGPMLTRDQYGVRRISKVARTLQSDYERLTEEYERIPPFHPPATDRLSQADLDRFLKVYYDSVKEVSYFKNKVVGKEVGIFRTIAWVGMVGGFYEVVMYRSLVANNMKQEEFDWTRTRIMMAALYCVEYKLDRENLNDEQKQRLTTMRDALYVAADVRERLDSGEYVDHFDRLKLNLVPRSNIELFLDNYANINYPGVHFDRPTPVTFDREATLAAAASNPP
jgi:hypothetical protein